MPSKWAGNALAAAEGRGGEGGGGIGLLTTRRQAGRVLAGAVLAVSGGWGLAGCGRVPVPGAYDGPGSAAVNLATATPSHPASMFSVHAGTYALVARGMGPDAVGGGGDDLSYLFAEASGDGEWSCLVVSQGAAPGDGGAAMAGIMARNSAAPDARNVAVAVTDGNGVVFQWRRADGQPEEQWPIPIAIGVTAPIWVRLTRAGARWTAAYSLDGIHWENPQQTTVPFDRSPFLIGMMASIHTPAAEAVDVFKDLQGFTPYAYLSITPPGSAFPSA